MKQPVNISQEKWGGVEVKIAHPFLFAVLIALIFSYFLTAGYFLGHPKITPAAPAFTTANLTANPINRGIPLTAGPWGDMAYRRIFIESPEEYLELGFYETNRTRWSFGPSLTRDSATALLTRSSLNAEQLHQLDDAWAVKGGQTALLPSDTFIFSLSPSVREKIYTQLAHSEENTWQRYPCFFPAGSLEEFFAKDHLSPQSLDLLKKLSYPHGHFIFFADLPTALRQIKDPAEKIRFAKAASRRSTLLTGLRLTPNSNVDTLLSYWARAGQNKDLRPLFEGITKTAGASLPLMAIMPVRASSRLLTFPSPTLSLAERTTPHWTAFNFFRDPPDDRYSDLAFMKQKLESDFYPVFSDPAYGDLVFLMNQSGAILHSSVFIADNIVYTKCGGPVLAPWILLTIPEMEEAFAAMSTPEEPLHVMYYRNKYY